MKSDKVTDQVVEKLRIMISDVKRYVEKRIELMLLNSGEHFSRWMAISVQRISGALLIAGGACFLLIALAIYLGTLLNSPSLGYVIVSIPLFIMGFSFIYLKPRRILNTLQQRFEEEMIEAVEKDNRRKPKELESEVLDHSLNCNE